MFASSRALRLRLATDHLDRIVVAMLVGDQQQIYVVGLDRRVVELEAPVGQQRPHVAEGIDEDLGLRAAQGEGGLSVPLNAHVAPPVAGTWGRGSIGAWAGSSAWWYWPPRSSEAAAATRQATIAKVKAVSRPSLKGWEIRWGKKAWPVSAAWAWVGSAARACGPTRRWIGL